MSAHPLPDFLALAVPLEMQRMAHLDGAELARIARAQALAIAERGDVVQFKAKGTAASTASLIRGLAAMALAAEGGVTFAGKHWCGDHSACVAAEGVAS